jgi:hypothetical protein
VGFGCFDRRPSTRLRSPAHDLLRAAWTRPAPDAVGRSRNRGRARRQQITRLPGHAHPGVSWRFALERTLRYPICSGQVRRLASHEGA